MSPMSMWGGHHSRAVCSAATPVPVLPLTRRQLVLPLLFEVVGMTARLLVPVMRNAVPPKQVPSAAALVATPAVGLGESWFAGTSMVSTDGEPGSCAFAAV